MEMFNVNIFLSSALFVREAVRLFLFTGQLSKDQVDIKKESFCHGSTRIVPALHR